LDWFAAFGTQRDAQAVSSCDAGFDSQPLLSSIEGGVCLLRDIAIYVQLGPCANIFMGFMRVLLLRMVDETDCAQQCMPGWG
jgi:hypothetical protein